MLVWHMRFDLTRLCLMSEIMTCPAFCINILCCFVTNDISKRLTFWSTLSKLCLWNINGLTFLCECCYDIFIFMMFVLNIDWTRIVFTSHSRETVFVRPEKDYSLLEVNIFKSFWNFESLNFDRALTRSFLLKVVCAVGFPRVRAMGFLPGDNVRLKLTGKTVTVQQSNGHAVKAGAGYLKAASVKHCFSFGLV